MFSYYYSMEKKNVRSRGQIGDHMKHTCIFVLSENEATTMLRLWCLSNTIVVIDMDVCGVSY